MNPVILGLNYSYHDSSACLIKDGAIAFAIEEERLTRHKHSQAFPRQAINACLQHTGTATHHIDHIAISAQPGQDDALKLGHAAGLGDIAGNFMRYEFDRLHARHMAFWRWFQQTWHDQSITPPQVQFIDHHLAHGLGTFLVSPWDRAAVLSIDGWGEWSTSWLGHADKDGHSCLGKSRFPHSLGMFYSAATQFCGFMPNYDEGKTMGLAPYGDPKRYFDIVDSIVTVSDDGKITLDLAWFDFPHIGTHLYSEKFATAFGAPRGHQQELRSNHRDVAAAFQSVLEKNILKIARALRDKTAEDHLIYAGGVALNSVANGKILSSQIFKDIYLMPGAGDNGTAIGAAAVLQHHLPNPRTRPRHATPYIGTGYSAAAIKRVLRASKLQFDEIDDPASMAADLLDQGKIVGWFQGRMEFGPRALGNRSILANPTCPAMKDRVNHEVKHREAFRPFAPAVTIEAAPHYFEIDVAVPYMLKVAAVRDKMQAAIPAVVHVDGTARLQTVDKITNPLFHSLITAFGKQSGHPVVLNTSFNVMGEPIVESPADALRCFFSTGLDALIIGPYFLSKPATMSNIHAARSES